MASKNLDGATFEEKRGILNKLDIKVYPSEDLKMMRVKCELKLTIEGENNRSVGEDGCEIVMFGLPRSEGPPILGSYKEIRVSSHWVTRLPDFLSSSHNFK